MQSTENPKQGALIELHVHKVCTKQFDQIRNEKQTKQKVTPPPFQQQAASRGGG